MAYRYDENLEFLSNCTNDELEGLFNILVYDKDGEKRYTEELTSSAECKRYKRNFKMYWKSIAAELQYFGGNTVVNIFRRSGVEYEELLNDVLENLKISFSDLDTVEEKENFLLEKTMENMLDKMNLEEKKEFAKDVGIKELNLSKGMMALACQGIIKAGGVGLVRLSTYIGAYISRVAIGKAATFGAGKVLSAFTGPIGWGITGAWTILDIASPAMRVTIPATIMVSCLRKIVNEREKNKGYKFITCPECEVSLKVKEEAKRVKCPNCEAVFEA